MASLLFWTVDPTLLITFVVAIFGPVGAYLIAARRMSGRIANSDAEQLWTESKAIRDWSTERIKICEKETKDLRKALSTQLNRCSALESENVSLKSRLNVANQRMEELIQIIGKQRGRNG